MNIEELKDIVNNASINIKICEQNIAGLEKKIFSNFGIKNKKIGEELIKRTKEIDSLVLEEKRLFLKANRLLNKISKGENYD